MNQILIALILLFAGSPLACLNANINSSEGILVADHGQTIKVVDESALTRIIEEASKNDLAVLSLAIADNEISKFQKQGLVIVKTYKEPVLIKVGGFSGLVPVSKICVVISDEDRYVLAYSGTNVSVMSLANNKAEEIKELLKR